MVGAVPSSSLDLRPLRPRVGAAAYERGAAFVRKDAVSWIHWDESKGTLSGVVRGKTGTYQTVAEFERVGDRWVFAEGDCSCPVEFDCKHVVALVLTAADREAASAAHPKPVLASWERALAPIVGGDDVAQRDTTPLALQLSLSTPSGRKGHSLTAKPVRPGKSGWISGGLTWGQFAMPYYLHEFAPEQVNALSAFYAVYQARSGRRGYSGVYYSGANQPVDLAEFESPHLWTLLDDLRSAGIAIVHSRKHLGVVPAPAEAEFCLDVTRRAGGGLTVRPLVRLTADEEPVRPLVFLGSEAHGLAFAAAGDREVVAGQQRIRLARLTTTVPQPLQDMALAGGEVTVPAGGAARFIDRFYFELRRRATIISSDGSFSAPDVSEPSLVLNATYRPGHELELAWEWTYGVGDAERRVPAGPGSESWRDPDAEAAAVAELDRHLGELGLDTRLPVHPGSAGAPGVLDGVETMRFSTEVLPLLSEMDGLDVDIHGIQPDYREVNDQVAIGLSTGAGDEPDWFDLEVSVSVEGTEIPLAKVITALTREQSHLLLDSGAYISLDKPELQALRRLVEEARALQDTSTGLRISRYQAGLWDELSSLGVVHRQAGAWRAQVEGLLNLDTVAAEPAPATLLAQLRPYQMDGFGWLAFLWRHRLGGILADDMGLGKTVQSLALICHAKEHDAAVAPFLIVAPTSVVPNWVAEAKRFAPDLKVAAITNTRRRRGRPLADILDDVDIVVTSYTLFRLDYDADYSAATWSALILDEAQMVKNHQSKTYQAARKLAARFKLAITGTPMENNLMELWSLLSITAPGLFPSPTRFEEYYAKPIEKNRDGDLLAQLRRRIRPLVKRRTKEQVAGDLPPKQEQVLEVELHPKHRRVYDRQLQRERQKVLGLVDDMDKNRFTILRSLTLLRQLSLHAGLVDEANRHVPSAKVEALVEHITDVVGSGHRALIFSQFTGFLGTIRDAVEAAGYGYCYLDGQTRDRARVLDEFKSGDVPLFLISLKAGGFGLNLTEADYCFLLDPWWNPATETQAIDRTHRIGQTKNVMVYRLIAKDTIEQKVMELKERKAALFSSVMDDGNVFGSGLSADDVRNLFQE
ncbi:MAG TPA: SNF2-related protein [Jiangellaceae bacterium]